MGKFSSVIWPFLYFLDVAVMVAGAACWIGYHHLWGVPIVLLGASGLALAAYETVKKDREGEAVVEAELTELQHPPSE